MAAAIGLGSVLSGCGSTGGAPVVSREALPLKVRTERGYHKVNRGETLYSIAWAAGLDFQQLAAWNGISSPYTIYPGQLLRLIPSPASKKRVSRQQAKRPPETKSSSARTGGATKSGVSSSKSVEAADNGSVKAASRRLAWQWPTSGKLAQRFSKKGSSHKGIGIGGRLGQPVLAAEAGKIVYSGSGLIGYGRLIIIKHDKDYLSAYGHNRKVLVKEGDSVAKGERIAEMGSTGSGSPMLHFEIRRKGNPVDPVSLLPPRH